MTRLRVATFDLRCALKAVAPHADPDPDFPPLHRIRLDVDQVNVTVSATNRSSAGIALVSVEDPDSGKATSLDLSPKDVKDLLSQFPGHARKQGYRPAEDEDDPAELLELAWDDTHLTATDVGGLFDGKSLRLPRYPQDGNFPNVPKLLAGMLARPFTGEPAQARRLAVQGKLLGLFKYAAGAYDEPVVLEPTGANGSIVVSCGESFIGALMPVRFDEVGAARLDDWRKNWVARLPQVGVQDALEGIPEPERPASAGTGDDAGSDPPAAPDSAQEAAGGGQDPDDLAAPRRRRGSKATAGAR